MIEYCDPRFEESVRGKGGETHPRSAAVRYSGAAAQMFSDRSGRFTALAMAQKRRKENAQELVYDGWEAVESLLIAA